MRLPFLDRDPESYRRDIVEGLDRVFDDPRVEEQVLDLDDARVIVLSDQHRGARDGADDFQRCERAYNAALAWYLETGYRLLLLGDVEELWENRAKEVAKHYGETLRLEAEFHRRGRLERFWGNHDDDWIDPSKVQRHLPALRDLPVREGLKLRVRSGGEELGLIFLVHGHQGTFESEQISGISRFFVRHPWRWLQGKVGFASNTPAVDWDLREKHERAMFEWAKERRPGLVLITGHTHRPVFGTEKASLKIARTKHEVERELGERRAARDADPEELGRLRAELEWIRAEERRHRKQPIDVVPPCYFNTGCCSYGDGDVTGLEISGGKIRLVRWSDVGGRPGREELADPRDLREVLAQVRG